MLKPFSLVTEKKGRSRRILQQGLSLIEASMVLILSAIVVSGTMAYYQSASNNNKLNKTTEITMQAVTAIKGAYANQDNYGNDIIGFQDVVHTLLPNLSYDRGQNFLLPFPEAVIQFSPLIYDAAKSAASSTTATAMGNAFGIRIIGTPPGLCSRVLSFNYGASLVALAAIDASQIKNNQILLLPASSSMQQRLQSCQDLQEKIDTQHLSFGDTVYMLVFQ